MTTLDLSTLVATARAIVPVLRLGRRHEAARVMEALIEVAHGLAIALHEERQRSAALTQALQEALTKGSAR